MKLKIAVPSKGRISDPAVNILKKAGLKLKDDSNRKLMSATYNENIDIMFVRAADIPTFVADGIVDMGITGFDLINENNADVNIMLDLNFGQTCLVLASSEESEINSVKDLKNGMKIATEFPNLTKQYLKNNNLEDIEIVKLTGSTEIAPSIGIADAITDLTSTGTTLKKNHLKIIDTILKSSIKLISNHESFKNKKELVEAVSISVGGVINAEDKKLVMMNVAEKYLNNVKEVMPSMCGPTISQVLSTKKMVAMQAVVSEGEVFDLVNKLRNAGATDILVVPIERIIK